jgi:hypothetical protein
MSLGSVPWECPKYTPSINRTGISGDNVYDLYYSNKCVLYVSSAFRGTLL